MTLKQNRTPVISYVVMALLAAAGITAVAIRYHPGPAAYWAGGGVWVIGILIMIWQIIKSGDTTILPYAVQIIGAVVFWLIAGSA